MNEPQGVDISSEMCKIDSKICDRSCGLKFHINVKRKEPNIYMPEDPQDAMMCESCQ